MAKRLIDWDAYLTDFHAASPGITEDVLLRSHADGIDPYRWLTDEIPADATILDLGCGSGPARPPAAERWAGIDLSASELERAVHRGRAAVIRGDMAALPIPSRSVDVVSCSMAMMLAHPITEVLSEVRRVLRPGGQLRLLLPARSPLTAHDRVTYLRLFVAARATTQFPPTQMRRSAKATLEAAGLTIASDERRRFNHVVTNAEDAHRFVRSWYLPTVTPERRSAAQRRGAALAPFPIGIPLRRIVAITESRTARD